MRTELNPWAVCHWWSPRLDNIQALLFLKGNAWIDHEHEHQWVNELFSITGMNMVPPWTRTWITVTRHWCCATILYIHKRNGTTSLLCTVATVQDLRKEDTRLFLLRAALPLYFQTIEDGILDMIYLFYWTQAVKHFFVVSPHVWMDKWTAVG